MQPFNLDLHLEGNTAKINFSLMKNSLTLAGRIFCSAFFLFTSLNSVFAQPGNDAKSVKEWVWQDENIYRKELLADGIPAATIEKLIQTRKELIFSGRNVSTIHHAVDVRKSQNPSPFAACSDMGGENGWGSWTAHTGVFSGSLPIPWSGPLTPTAPRFNLTSGAGNDACTPGPNPGDPPIPVVAPGFGNASLQIGQIQTNGSLGGCGSGCAEQLTYPLTVTPQDTNFTFSYAVVIEDPNHSATDQPFVSLCIYDSNGTPLPCGCFTYTAGPNLPGFYTTNCFINSVSYYRPWTLVGINLGPYVGQTLTVEIVNADCALSGHFAQSYWDFSCGTISTAAQYCLGEDSLLLIAPSVGPGFTYSWSPGGSTNDSIIVNPQLIDTVVLSIIPPSGCGYYQVYALFPTIINTAISYSISCNQVTFSDSLTTIQGGTISNWIWNFPGGNPNGSASQTPPVVTYPPGTYTASLTVVSQAGCTDTTATVSFTINPPPVVTANSVSICQSMTGTLCASGTNLTYVWIPSNQTTTCITVTTASASTYTVIGTDSNGCFSTTTANVSTNLQPNITASSGSVCATNNGNNCPTLSAAGGVTYTWSPANYLSSTSGSSVVACPTSTTSYTVTGTDANGCTNTAVSTVTALQNPAVTACCPATICLGQSQTVLSASSNPPSASYSWVPVTGLSCTNCANPIANPPFSNTYTVYVTDVNGCTDAASVPVNVGSIPFVSAIASTTVCTGGTAQLNANTSNGVGPYNYYWTPPNSPPISNPNIQNPTTNPLTTTIYTVTVTDANGCKDDTSTTIYVQTIPSVSWASWTPTLTCDGIIVPLKANMSSNGQSVFWDFGDGTSTTTAAGDTVTVPHSYPYNGTYSVTVIVYNQPCKDTVDTVLVVGDVGAGIGFCAANVFTPNGDNDNDYFQPAIMNPNCSCVPSCTLPAPDPDEVNLLKQCMWLEVYDRWGIKMFETTDSQKSWDGKTMGGHDAKQGTYYYIAKLGEVTIRGYVTLLRQK